MSLAEQALFLLDIPQSIKNRLKLENFTCLEQTIVASFPGTEEKKAEAPAPAPSTETDPFFVATRMNRPHYEDQARAEALTQALRQIRASNASKLRGTGQSGRA